jgi:glycosyltransferase involved in cell wall biosynthesis
MEKLTMDIPEISVIVPVYNSEKYLEYCINSILSQTFKYFECLLIDDCSTDNSLKICNNFRNKDNRVKVYHKLHNEGTAQARKTGIFYAIAEYVIFIDNDDWIESIMLEELYTKIRAANLDMVCCDFIFEENENAVYKRQDIKDRTNIELIKKVISWENFWDFLPVTWNKLVRTEIYKKIDYPKTIYSEDRAIMTQVLFFSNKIGYINKGLYHWCQNHTSASNNNKRELQNIIDDYISYITILLFVIEKKINIDILIKEILTHIDYVDFKLLKNKIVLNLYKNSLNKLSGLKLNNKLTKKNLFLEERYFINRIKFFFNIYLVVELLKRLLPKRIKIMIKYFLKR